MGSWLSGLPAVVKPSTPATKSQSGDGQKYPVPFTVIGVKNDLVRGAGGGARHGCGIKPPVVLRGGDIATTGRRRLKYYCVRLLLKHCGVEM